MAELAWLAVIGEPGREPAVPVRAAVSGGPAGYLLLVRGRAKPDRAAVRVAPEVLGEGVGDGPELAVSLVLPPRGHRPLFDDPAVVHALRVVLATPGRAAVFSTLVDGATDWAGAISGIDADRAARWPAWWDEDPFARLGPRRRLLVPAGVLRAAPLPAGPGHQRHAGAPWPWGRFDDARNHPGSASHSTSGPG